MVQRSQSQSHLDSLPHLAVAMLNIQDPIFIHMDDGVMGKEYDFWIYPKDVMELLINDEFCVSVIQLFQM